MLGHLASARRKELAERLIMLKQSPDYDAHFGVGTLICSLDREVQEARDEAEKALNPTFEASGIEPVGS